MALGVLLAMALASPAEASILYRWERLGAPSGDTIGLGGMTDAGDVLLVGYGDAGGRSRVVNRGGLAPDGFVEGLPWPMNAFSPEFGVDVRGINSQGDMHGYSFNNDFGPQPVPTFWRNGIAYDMTDPANAGLVFVRDPGVSAGRFNFASLDIVNMLPGFLPFDYEQWLSEPHFALTNSKGEFALEVYGGGMLGDVFLLVPFEAPEPGSLSLLLAGLAVIAHRQRLRRRSAKKEAEQTDAIPAGNVTTALALAE